MCRAGTQPFGVCSVSMITKMTSCYMMGNTMECNDSPVFSGVNSTGWLLLPSYDMCSRVRCEDLEVDCVGTMASTIRRLFTWIRRMCQTRLSHLSVAMHQIVHYQDTMAAAIEFLTQKDHLRGNRWDCCLTSSLHVSYEFGCETLKSVSRLRLLLVPRMQNSRSCTKGIPSKHHSACLLASSNVRPLRRGLC